MLRFRLSPSSPRGVRCGDCRIGRSSSNLSATRARSSCSTPTHACRGVTVPPVRTRAADLSDVVLVMAAVLLACSGILYIAGGLSTWLVGDGWIHMSWPSAIRVLLEPSHPAKVFDSESDQPGPVL